MTKYLKKEIILIALAYIVLAASVGVFFPFNALYLSGTLNFTNAQISFVDGFGQLAAMLFLPIAGIISDRTGRPGLTFIFLMIFSGILLLFYARLNSFVYVALVYIGYLMLRRGIFPILDALTLNICEHYQLNFGIFRSIYSGCFMLFAIGMGFIFKNQSVVDNSFIYISIIFNLVVTVIAIFLPRFKVEPTKKANFKVDLKELIKNKNFLLFSCAIALAMATVSIVSMYNPTIIHELGGKVESIGLATIMQMGSEVIFALFALKLAKKYGHLKIIVIAMIVLIARWLINAAFFEFSYYYYLIWIEGFTTIFILIVGMDYVKTIVLPQLIATSITIYTSITLLFYAILVNISGALRDNYGTTMMFYFQAIISILALLMTIYLLKTLKHKKQD